MVGKVEVVDARSLAVGASYWHRLWVSPDSRGGARADDRAMDEIRATRAAQRERAEDEREELAQLHDEENRAEFAIRKEEREMAAEEEELEHEMKEFEEEEARAKRRIEAELRAEHHGHQPERPIAWGDGEAGSEDSDS